MTNNSNCKPRHGYCFYCHGKLFNLKGSYRHENTQKAIECAKLRDTRMLIDEKGFDLFYGEHRQIKQGIIKMTKDIDELKQQSRNFTDELIKYGVKSYSFTFDNGFKVTFSDKKSAEYRQRERTKQLGDTVKP